MERFILRYSHGDGCTYSCTVVRPVLYESAEALLVDFMNAAKKARTVGDGAFKFCGEKFDSADFYQNVDAQYANVDYVTFGKLVTYEVTPDILTVDEFFSSAMRPQEAAGN